jgi:hypothetical protein
VIEVNLIRRADSSPPFDFAQGRSAQHVSSVVEIGSRFFSLNKTSRESSRPAACRISYIRPPRKYKVTHMKKEGRGL